MLISSSGVYGTPSAATTAAQSEHGPLQLDNLYSIAKYSAELLGARYAELSGKSIVSARLAAPFGPLERPTGSRTHMGHPQRLLAALRAGQRVRVAGSEVTRDWTYVEDTADAIRGLLLAPRLRYPVYNVSCGVAIPFRKLVDAFAAHGLEAEWVADGAASDIAMHESQRRAPLDITRLAADTGWKPRFDVRAGVERYLLPSEAVVASQ